MLCFVGPFALCGDIPSKDSDTSPKIPINKQATILVFPVDVPAVNNHQLGKQFATALALALERTGLANLEVSEKVFQPPAESKDDIVLLSKDFSMYIKQQKNNREYVYFSQFIGDQTTGPQAVLSVFVNNNGDLLWSHRSVPGEASFDKYDPKDPLGKTTSSGFDSPTCCTFSAQETSGDSE